MTFSDPVTDIGTVGHIFINLIAWDQGSKEWWKVDAKEKEKKNSKKNQKYIGLSDKGIIQKMKWEKQGKKKEKESYR